MSADTPGLVPRRAVVLGVGNEFRRDDGAGPHVVGRLRRLVTDRAVQLLVSDAEPARLVEAWTGVALAIVVDAVLADPCVPGRTHRIVIDGAAGEAGPAAVAAAAGRLVSSHGQGLAMAIGLARALGRMPARLVVHAIEAGDVSCGTGLTPAVAVAAQSVVGGVLRDLAAGAGP